MFQNLLNGTLVLVLFSSKRPSLPIDKQQIWVYHRYMRVKTKRNQKVLEFYQKGYTQNAIAKIFHISQVTVSRIIAREKVKEINWPEEGE